MKLISNWQRVARKAWSIKFILLSGALSAIEFALPFVAPVQPSGWFAGAAALVSVAAFVSRFIAQPRSLP